MAKFNIYPMFLVIVLNATKDPERYEIYHIVGDNVSLSCYSNEDIQWHYNSMFNFVVAGGRLWGEFRDRFSMNNEIIGKYELNIHNVNMQDAGWYYCSEEISGRRIKSTHLTILAMSPVCSNHILTDELISPNTCGIKNENIRFGCSITFNGTSPNVIWMYEDTILNSSCEINSNVKKCDLNIKAAPSFDGAVFVCNVGNITNNNRYKCSTQKTKINYFFANKSHEEKNLHENAVCAVESNMNINYTWMFQQNNIEIFLSSNKTVAIENLGFYWCKVKYNIKNITCTLLVASINVTAREIYNENTTAPLSVILSVVLFIVLVISLFSILYNIKQSRLVRENSRSLTS